MEQIIVSGGGGFSYWGLYSSEDRSLSEYLLKQSHVKEPAICFIPTASSDDKGYIINFYTEFTPLRCKPSHLTLSMPPRDLEASIYGKDIIYVGGGSTQNLLALWREWQLDHILKKALHRGVILSGISAGMNCWFEECVTDSLTESLTPMKGLGFLKGSACPHYDSEPERRPTYHALLKNGQIGEGIAAEDHTLIHYVDGELKRVLTSKESSAYLVSKKGQEIEEKRLKALSAKADSLS